VAAQSRAAIDTWVEHSLGAAASDELVSELCMVSSSYLHERLEDAGQSPKVFSGWLRCDLPSPALDPLLAAGGHVDAAHYWVVLDGWIVDITADQFNPRITRDAPFPPVIVQPVTQLKRHIPSAEVEPFRPEDGVWPAAFRRMARRVRRAQGGTAG